MVGAGWLSRIFVDKSADSRCSHMASFVASDVVMYSAFVVDMVVHS